jgi:hypothetical protein
MNTHQLVISMSAQVLRVMELTVLSLLARAAAAAVISCSNLCAIDLAASMSIGAVAAATAACCCVVSV